MLYWCGTLLGLGILAFLDTIFSYGDIFRKVNSVLFMLLSLGLLVRTKMMVKLQKMEKLTEQNTELKQQVDQLSQSHTQKEKKPEIAY